MEFGISHDRSDHSFEAKARWFQSLTLEERMDIFCEMADLVLTVNPKLGEKKALENARQIQGRVRILQLP